MRRPPRGLESYATRRASAPVGTAAASVFLRLPEQKHGRQVSEGGTVVPAGVVAETRLLLLEVSTYGGVVTSAAMLRRAV